MSIGAIIASAIAAAGAASAAGNKGSSSSSSSSSGSSSSGSSSSSGGSSSSSSSKTIADYQADYNAAKAAGDQAGMDAAHKGAEALRATQGYSGGVDGSEYIPVKSNYANDYSGKTPNYQLTQADVNSLLSEAAANSAQWGSTDEAGKQQLHERNRSIYGQLGYDYDAESGEWSPNAFSSSIQQAATLNTAEQEAKDEYAEYLAAQQDAADAATEQAIAALESQKYDVNKAGTAANQAAQDAYMQTINPNGSLAESLASRGLLSSGLTESSQIAAGNTYQQALNQNATSVAEQLQEIELAIVEARRSGDISKAQALAEYAERVAAVGLQTAQQIAGIQQWGWTQNQTDEQNAIANQQAAEYWEWQKKQIELDYEMGKITKQEEEIQLKYADQMQQATLEGMLLSNQGTSLSNQSTSLNNQYASLHMYD